MTNLRSAVVYALACATCASLSSGCGNAGSGRVLAEVGGIRITEAALAHWSKVRQGPAGAPLARHKVLSQLIMLQQVVGEAAEYGVHASEAEARKGLDLLTFDGAREIDLELVAEEPKLRHLLTAPGLTDADRIWLVKAEMLALRLKQRLLVEARKRISDQQVARYYGMHRKDFMTPERRDMEIFLTYDLANAEKGRREVVEGTSFRTVADRRNVSQEGGREGLVMGLARGAGEPAFEKYVFAAKPHVLLGPIKQVLYYVFRITKIVPGHLRTLPEVDAEIRRRLISTGAFTLLWEKINRRWVSRTNCSTGYVVEQCRTAAAPTIKEK